MKTYTMENTYTYSLIGTQMVTEYLLSKPETIRVKDVSNDPEYMKKDIDLMWYWSRNGINRVTTLEIKADRYPHTGNYFIETVSNKEKGTPGCILYTEADYIVYCFPDTGEINLIPTRALREWFLKNISKFPEKELSTKVDENRKYTSLGRLVPRKILNKNVKGVRTRMFCVKT